MRGVTLVPKTVVVLSLDGALVYVEDIQPTFAAVVALPEQPANTDHAKLVFTPGRVGAKKISPFAGLDRQVPVTELSERNRKFLDTYAQLRDDRGPNHVDRTSEEEAALAAAATAATAPLRASKTKLTPDEKAAAKEAKRAAKKAASKGAVPRYLQRCQTCNEQPGHPNHSGDNGHEFVAPLAPTAPAASDPSKPVKAPKAPRPARAAAVSIDSLSFKWVGVDGALDIIAAGNPKYKEGNSGRAIAEAVKAGAATTTAVAAQLANHDRWKTVSLERISKAFTQLRDAKLIEVIQ